MYDTQNILIQAERLYNAKQRISIIWLPIKPVLVLVFTGIGILRCTNLMITQGKAPCYRIILKAGGPKADETH